MDWAIHTSAQCLSQCNPAPRSCLGAQSTVWNKETHQQRHDAVTTHCILYSLADLLPVHACLAPLHPKSRWGWTPCFHVLRSTEQPIPRGFPHIDTPPPLTLALIWQLVRRSLENRSRSWYRTDSQLKIIQEAELMAQEFHYWPAKILRWYTFYFLRMITSLISYLVHPQAWV